MTLEALTVLGSVAPQTAGYLPASHASPGSGELLDWRPINNDRTGTRFSAYESSSGRRYELYLLPWLASRDRLASIQRQIRLVEHLAPASSRKVVRADLETLPPRLVFESEGVRLSEMFADLSCEKRLHFAHLLWSHFQSAFARGLYHGAISSEHIRIIDPSTHAIQIDYFTRYYLDETCVEEPTFERECRALICLISDLLRSIAQNAEYITNLPGRNRSQLKNLLRIGVEEGCELDRADQWSQWFADAFVPSSSTVPVLEHEDRFGRSNAHQAASIARESRSENGVEVESKSVDGAEDKTGEVEVFAVNTPRSVQFLPECGDRIGRFRLTSMLGQGGMGVVYRGIDVSTGAEVAVKVLRPTRGDIAQAVRRFRKEARLLATIQNEYVTRLLDAGHDNGFHYLAMEYVAGTNLRDWLKEHPNLSETQALTLVADIARALVDAHQKEIVHRDIKPENVLLSLVDSRARGSASQPLAAYQVKLSDFGIARSMQQSVSMEMTRAGTLLGTPTYMSPEQCKGGNQVTPASDIYALGVMLYALIAGKPPFEAEEPMKLAAMHCFQAPIDLKKINRSVSDSTAALVNRMLSKDPAQRPGDAAQLVGEIERILRGDPSDLEAHPLLPENSSAKIWERVFQWTLQSSPDKLWPYVSNTERLNRAAGLQAVTYRTEEDRDGTLRKFGAFRLAGLQIEWEEHPFEWVEGRRMGVLREFARGPFRWFMSLVELAPTPNGGTLLTHTVRIDPRNQLGRLLASIEAGWKGGRALNRIYTRIDHSIQHQRHNAFFDPYEMNCRPSNQQQRRAEQRVDKMIELGVKAETAQLLKAYILSASPQVLANLKPIELAEQLQLPVDECLDACLVAAHCGLLRIRWDILCPTCRAAASTTALLAEIGKHTACAACDAEFASNVASAIELAFQAHPEIREVDDGQYCIGGPEHSPHVVTQIRLAPHERIELNMQLTVGDYQLRVPRRPQPQPLRVRAQCAPASLDQRLSNLGASSHTPVVRSGSLTISLTNDLPTTQVVRLERTVNRNNIVTAATASTLARFRALFPEQIFSRDNAVASEDLALVAFRIVSVDQLYTERGDAAAYQLLQSALQLFEDCINAHQGGVIKSVGETLLGCFRDSSQAVRAAMDVHRRLAELHDLAELSAVSVVHRGPVLVTTQNGRLDYFGTTARQVLALCEQFQEGVVVSDVVFSDAAVHSVLNSLGSEPVARRTVTMPLPGAADHLIQQIFPL